MPVIFISLYYTHKGTCTSELNLLPAVFQAYPSALYWKIDLALITQASTGRASLILKRNLLPQGGSCSVDLSTGTSMSTQFNIICINWVDPDGYVVKYEFMATYSGNSNPITLNYNSNGSLSIQLPQGPCTDAYNIYLSVNIIDDTEGLTMYNIPNPVSVMPNYGVGQSLSNAISSNDFSSALLMYLNSENLNIVSKNVISLATAFNIESSSPVSCLTTNSSMTNDQMSVIREYLVRQEVDLSVSDMSSIKVISSALAAATQNRNQVSMNIAVML